MLDRLIAGAGAFAFIADKLAAGSTGRRIGSLVAAAVLLVLGVLALMAWAEATDNPTPRQLTAGEASSLSDIGRRTFADVSGAYSLSVIERYRDDNDNDTRDPEETSLEWIYFLGSGSEPMGIAVRSDSAPADVFKRTFEGRILEDPDGIAEDVRLMGADLEGVTVDPVHLIDATVPADAPTDLAVDATTIPAAGSSVRVSGELSLAWVSLCPSSADCEMAGADGFDYVVFDPVSRRGMIVYATTRPDQIVEATVRGMIRESTSSVDDILSVDSGDRGDAGVALSSSRYLDAGDAPANGTTLLLGALAAFLLGSILLVGWAAGSGVVFRRESAVSLSNATASFDASVPVRVSGRLLSAAGIVLERQAKASVKRITIGDPTAQPEAVAMPASTAPGTLEASTSTVASPTPVVEGWPSPSDRPGPSTEPVPAGWGTAAAMSSKAPSDRGPSPAADPHATVPTTAPSVAPPAASVDAPPGAQGPTEGAYGSLSAAYAAAGLTPGPATAALMAGTDTQIAAGDDPDRPGRSETGSAAVVRSVLVVERADGIAGIGIGSDGTRTLSSGRAVAFRGARPALRIRTDAGMLVLAFEDAASRDRVRAAIIADAGLTTDADGISRDPAWKRSSSKT